MHFLSTFTADDKAACPYCGLAVLPAFSIHTFQALTFGPGSEYLLAISPFRHKAVDLVCLEHLPICLCLRRDENKHLHCTLSRAKARLRGVLQQQPSTYRVTARSSDHSLASSQLRIPTSVTTLTTDSLSSFRRNIRSPTTATTVTVPRASSQHQAHHKLQTTDPTKCYIQHLALAFKMSVSYETRNFIHDGAYAPVGEHDHGLPLDHFSDPDVANLAAVATSTYAGDVASPFAEPDRLGLDPSHPQKEDSPVATHAAQAPAIPTAAPPRIKPIPKPDRQVTKNMDGKYICTNPNCTEAIKEFARKCEWR